MSELEQKPRILVLHYSQTGQLDCVVESIVAPLQASATLTVDFLELTPKQAYPFPWPFIRFINTFPEAIYEKGCELALKDEHIKGSYDLVILAYQVWFLAPSIPTIAFLQTEQAKSLLKDTPVVTVIACRNMWLQAQEKVKAHLHDLGAKLVGNIALVDACGSAISFLSTPLWLLTGNKGPYRFGVPRAGVSDEDISNASRFGQALVSRMSSGEALDETVLQGLAAVTIFDKLIPSEKIATRSFYIWGKLFLLCGGPDAPVRKLLAVLYAIFLIAMILTVVPISALLKKVFSPLLRRRIKKQKKYFSWPSGE